MNSLPAPRPKGDSRLGRKAGPASVALFSVLLSASFALAAGAPGAGASRLVVLDANADGSSDLAVVGATANTVALYLSDGDGHLNSQPLISPAGAVGAVGGAPVATTADVDKDGRADLVLGRADGTRIAVLRGRGDGHFEAPIASDGIASPGGMALGDFDGDGVPDLAQISPLSNKILLLRGDGSGRFNPLREAHVGFSPASIVAGDFGQTSIDARPDGKLDLVVALSGEDAIAILFGTGAGNFSPPEKFSVSNPSILSTGDFNGDGIADLAFARPGPATVGVSVGLASGKRGSFAAPTTAATFTPPTRPVTLTSGDLDGDGTTDLVVATEAIAPEDGAVWILLNRPLGPGIAIANFAAPIRCAVNTPVTAVAAGRFGKSGPPTLAIAPGNTDDVLLFPADEAVRSACGAPARLSAAPQPGNGA